MGLKNFCGGFHPVIGLRLTQDHIARAGGMVKVGVAVFFVVEIIAVICAGVFGPLTGALTVVMVAFFLVFAFVSIGSVQWADWLRSDAYPMRLSLFWLIHVSYLVVLTFLLAGLAAGSGVLLAKWCPCVAMALVEAPVSCVAFYDFWHTDMPRNMRWFERTLLYPIVGLFMVSFIIGEFHYHLVSRSSGPNGFDLLFSLMIVSYILQVWNERIYPSGHERGASIARGGPMDFGKRGN